MNMPKSWRPYLTGALVGLLATLSVLVSTQTLGKPKYLGASTTFVRAAGLIEKSISAEHVAENSYYQAKKVKVDWQFMFVIGILLGAFAASLGDRSFKMEGVPPIWKKRFGNKPAIRAAGA
ncbi:MAG: YeeE/YedE family protein, partial [Deltaproteobacteria bacterium]